MKQNCGIYLITNKLNGMQYVGKSINLKKRLSDHLTYKNQLIDSQIAKYGADNFSFDIIEYTSEELLNEREIYWIQYYDTYNTGYNETQGGDGGGEHLYDYEAMVKEWMTGKSSIEIAKIYQCDRATVRRALRAFNISTAEAQRSYSARQVIAYSMITKEPLRIFNSINEANKFFQTGKTLPAQGIRPALKEPFIKSMYGFYWDYATNNSIPENILTDEVFLSYQQPYQNKEQSLESYISRRKVERPSREELKKLIRTKTFVEIGKQFNVDSTTIPKWCDGYNLPRRKREINNYTDEEWEKL